MSKFRINAILTHNNSDTAVAAARSAIFSDQSTESRNYKIKTAARVAVQASYENGYYVKNTTTAAVAAAAARGRARAGGAVVPFKSRGGTGPF